MIITDLAVFQRPDRASPFRLVDWRPASRPRKSSVSKTATGALAASLVNDGAVDLDRPVASWGTTLRLPGGAESRVTLGQLLSQQTGLTKNAYDERLEEGQSPARIRADLAAAPLQCEPGTCHTYQNVAFDAASEILGDAANRPFAEAVVDRFFRPLGMRSAGYGMDGLTARKTGRGRITIARLASPRKPIGASLRRRAGPSSRRRRRSPRIRRRSGWAASTSSIAPVDRRWPATLMMSSVRAMTQTDSRPRRHSRRRRFVIAGELGEIAARSARRRSTAWAGAGRQRQLDDEARRAVPRGTGLPASSRHLHVIARHRARSAAGLHRQHLPRPIGSWRDGPAGLGLPPVVDHRHLQFAPPAHCIVSGRRARRPGTAPAELRQVVLARSACRRGPRA
jgi:CubicO group peptidase (beta-lactamase class C family)